MKQSKYQLLQYLHLSHFIRNNKMLKIDPPYQIVSEQIPIYELREFTSIRDVKQKQDGTWGVSETYRIHYVRSDYHPIKQWTLKQQNQFINSLLQKTYIPPIVVRELDEKAHNNSTVWEILDGWHRIKTIQDFFGNRLIPLPDTIKSLPQFSQFATIIDNEEIIFTHCYQNLPEEYQQYIKTLTIPAHIIKGIETNTAENEKHAKLIHILLHPENDIL